MTVEDERLEKARAYRREYMRRRRSEDPDLNRRNYKKLKAKDPEYHRRWRDENRANINANARRREAETGRKKAGKRRRAEADPEAYKAANRRDAQNRAGRLRGFPPIVRTEFESLLLEYCGLCAYCLEPAEHFDHVEPLCLGGAHAIENIVPACGSCNCSKGKRPLLLWLAKNGPPRNGLRGVRF